MVKLALSCIFAMLISSVTVFAQVPDLSTVPDFSGSGWTLVNTETVSMPVGTSDGRILFNIRVVFKSYVHPASKFGAEVMVLNGQDVAIVYGTNFTNPDMFRMGIYDAGRWYPAKTNGPRLILSVVGDPTTNRAQVTLIMDTNDGEKEVIVNGVPMIRN